MAGRKRRVEVKEREKMDEVQFAEGGKHCGCRSVAASGIHLPVTV